MNLQHLFKKFSEADVSQRTCLNCVPLDRRLLKQLQTVRPDFQSGAVLTGKGSHALPVKRLTTTVPKRSFSWV